MKEPTRFSDLWLSSGCRELEVPTAYYEYTKRRISQFPYSDLVFSTPEGKPLRPNTISRA